MRQSERWQLAQTREKDYWERAWLNNPERASRTKEYWGWYLDYAYKYIEIKPESRVLDIGCGPHGIINYVAGERYGLDPLMDFYLSNFGMPEDVKWITSKAEDVPFEGSFFDIVFTTNTLDHVEMPKKVLEEINRVLKQGGFLFLTLNLYSHWTLAIETVQRKLGLGDQGHPHYLATETIKALLQETGFEVVDSAPGLGDQGSVVVAKTRKLENLKVRVRGIFQGSGRIREREGIRALLKWLASISIGVFIGIFVPPSRDSIFVCMKS